MTAVPGGWWYYQMKTGNMAKNLARSKSSKKTQYGENQDQKSIKSQGNLLIATGKTKK